jgi:hypothetical protein
MLAGLAVAAGASTAGAGATPVTHAVSTTTNVAATTGNGACLNGPATGDPVNCNIYSSKEDVWFSGLPNSAALGDGTYFFSVQVPGGQPDPNDGGAKNLSNSDAYSDRSFSIAGGTITNLGTHAFQNNELQLFPYDDTTNPGGVYILAVCKIDGASSYPVAANDCKYDAFKVQTGTETPSADPLTVTKDANGSFDDTYRWTITKGVDKTRVEQIGGSATFNYTVGVSHDGGTISGPYAVTGTITVFNPNSEPVSGVVVTDTLSDGTVCAVNGTFPDTVAAGETNYSYSCDLGGLPYVPLDNTAAVSWDDQQLTDGYLLGDASDFTFSGITFSANLIDECVDVTDTYAGALGTVCVGDANPTSFTYARTVSVPQYDCVGYDNTATFTATDTGATGSASQRVTVCGPAKTGALTMGFWQNKNGLGVITGGASTYGVCNSGTWLRQYAPFQDLSATASCAAVATYVSSVIKAATCTSTSKTCNSMLKAQMVATALDVYFTGSGSYAGSLKFLSHSNLGGVSIDLTKICRMIDGTGGIATCPGTFQNVSAAFGAASSLTVSQMLTHAASQSNVGGSAWYGQIKATQVLAKDAFDAINNQVAFSAV